VLIAALLAAAPEIQTPPAGAALIGSDTISQLVSAWAERDGVQQFSLAVWRGGKVVESLGYGGWDPAKPYPVASLSKAVTAVCIADLVQHGRLSFDDTLGKVLADYFQQAGDPSDPKFRSITIEQLLAHRAGMIRDPAGYATSMADAVRNTTHTMLTAPRVPSYSNGGYLMLGFVAQTVSGVDYETQCKKVLTRSGATGFIDPKLIDRAPNGGWEISAIDYAKFLDVFEPTNPALSPATRAWMMAQPPSAAWRPLPNTAYALGVQIARNERGEDVFYHNGKVSDDEGGGSYFIKIAGGYTVVVEFSGFNEGRTYRDLFDALYAALLLYPK